MNIFISTWVLLAAGLVFALPMIYLRVKDTTLLADEKMLVFRVNISRLARSYFIFQRTLGLGWSYPAHRSSSEKTDTGSCIATCIFCCFYEL